MSASPVEAEARGEEYITATFNGAEFQVPLDVDSWPLDAVRNSRGLNAAKQIVVNHPQLIVALQSLLGVQWESFVRAAPKRRDLAAASQVFAAAVGVPASVGGDVVFGAIPRLLAVLEAWPGKVESDLQRFWHIDYRNRWRFHRGRRRLTLRQIHERLSNLPTDSAVAIAINGGRLHKTGAELVLMDLFEAITHQRHPSRPMSAEQRAAREAEAKKDADDRAKYRQRTQKRKELQHIENARENARRAQEREAHV